MLAIKNSPAQRNQGTTPSGDIDAAKEHQGRFKEAQQACRQAEGVFREFCDNLQVKVAESFVRAKNLCGKSEEWVQRIYVPDVGKARAKLGDALSLAQAFLDSPPRLHEERSRLAQFERLEVQVAEIALQYRRSDSPDTAVPFEIIAKALGNFKSHAEMVQDARSDLRRVSLLKDFPDIKVNGLPSGRSALSPKDFAVKLPESLSRDIQILLIGKSSEAVTQACERISNFLDTPIDYAQRAALLNALHYCALDGENAPQALMLLRHENLWRYAAKNVPSLPAILYDSLAPAGLRIEAARTLASAKRGEAHHVFENALDAFSKNTDKDGVNAVLEGIMALPESIRRRPGEAQFLARAVCSLAGFERLYAAGQALDMQRWLGALSALNPRAANIQALKVMDAVLKKHSDGRNRGLILAGFCLDQQGYQTIETLSEHLAAHGGLLERSCLLEWAAAPAKGGYPDQRVRDLAQASAQSINERFNAWDKLSYYVPLLLREAWEGALDFWRMLRAKAPSAAPGSNGKATIELVKD